MIKKVPGALFLLLLALVAFPCKAQNSSDYPADLVSLYQNVWTDFLSGSTDREQLQKIMEGMSDRGTWADIDYASKQRGDWPPATHIYRLGTLARAWQKKDSPLYQDPVLLSKIHLALNYWLANDLICPNWWYPEIGIPMSFAPSLILMEKQLSAEQLSAGIKILDRARIRMTGQNKIWLSGNVLLKSLLLKDTETIRKAAASIQEELRVSLEEGVQPDGSFHQHGPQIQFGNYGSAYVGDMIKWIRILRNTPFSFDETKLSILRNYLLDGQQWIVWKNQMDISACGRQLFVDAQRSKARSIARFFSQMESLDPAFAGQYRQAGNYGTLTGNKHFWRSDFQVQRTPDYYFSVKMCSERVIGAESCNSENIRGYYLGDGATYLYQSGKEYENIFPYWDWKKIPGTTTIQDDKELPVLTASGYRIQSNFVGGVSDGSEGIAVLHYIRNGVTAKKSWFNFSGQVVCLGSGISGQGAFPLATTVNQCFLNGEVIVREQSEKTIPGESTLELKPAWILHDRTGYIFPESTPLKLETRSVTGSWNLVALMYKPENLFAPLFRLWIDHGVSPAEGKYAYILVTGADPDKMRKLEKKPAVKIIRNDPEMQAVANSDLSLGGAVFYRPGSVSLINRLEVDQPCVVLLRKSAGGLSLSLADPTQKLEQVSVTLDGSFRATGQVNATAAGKDKTLLVVSLPKGGEAGKTVTISLKKQ